MFSVGLRILTVNESLNFQNKQNHQKEGSLSVENLITAVLLVMEMKTLSCMQIFLKKNSFRVFDTDSTRSREAKQTLEKRNKKKKETRKKKGKSVT